MDTSLIDLNLPLATVSLALGIGGSLGVLGAALALGLRHGIDWDHIAAITDITSTAASAQNPDEKWLTGELGVMLTDESHHSLAAGTQGAAAVEARDRIAVGTGVAGTTPDVHADRRPANGHRPWAWSGLFVEHRRALFLGSMYALGHGSIVTVLGLVAILGSGLLPASIDPVMERVVGVTLILLAAYLFYSVYRFFRGDGEFRIRSRWMLVFAGVRSAFGWLRARADGRHQHFHAQATEQYGVKTAYGVGLIHGIGAETGTQVLVIATAVGAGTKAMGIAAMMAFVLGLIISNSVVTVATTAGFVSSRRRQSVYVLAGLLAAVFSLAIGLVFLFQAGDVLPDLGRYFHWLGGPNT